MLLMYPLFQLNTSLEDLFGSVKKLSATYLLGDGPVGRETREAVFLSQAQLDDYYLAEEKFTQELTGFTKKQFFEVN